jgi:Y_Y_Y domain
MAAREFSARPTGLRTTSCRAFLPDGDGHLWLSGNRGISRVQLADLDAVADGRKAHLEPLVLGSRDGMASAECVGGGQPAGWRSTDGRLFFPTIAGLVAIDPRHMITNRLAPPVVIEEVAIDGHVQPTTEALVVPPGTSRVEIRFTALSFNDPTSLPFRYRLDGFDRSWVEAGTRRLAIYTYLPPGRFRFRVVAANEDGVWGAGGASLSLRVEPRFFQTGWFVATVALALVLLGAGLQRLRLRRLERRQRELEAQVAARTTELAEANREIASDLALLEEREEQLRGLNCDLSRRVAEQTSELRETRDTAILTLARLAELRDGATGAHLERARCTTSARWPSPTPSCESPEPSRRGSGRSCASTRRSAETRSARCSSATRVKTT